MTQLCIRPDPAPQEIPRRSMAIVAKAILLAWDTLNTPGYRPSPNAPIFTSFADENDVTDQLVTILNTMADNGNAVLGFSNEYFQTIEIGSRQPNATRTNFGNQPDFVIRPQKRPSGIPSATYGVYVECKTIDETKGINLYITKGIKRFVDERYAWSMKHGLMLGYVFTQERLPGALDKGFSTLRKKEYKFLKSISPAVQSNIFPGCEAHETTHPRTSISTPIRLDHMWLSRDLSC